MQGTHSESLLARDGDDATIELTAIKSTNSLHGIFDPGERQIRSSLRKLALQNSTSLRLERFFYIVLIEVAGNVRDLDARPTRRARPLRCRLLVALALVDFVCHHSPNSRTA